MNNSLQSLLLESNTHEPMYVQIYNGIRHLIIQKELNAGTKLPATRDYAVEIGVSRTTIISAFDQLKAEGYITARQGSGYIVNDIGDVAIARKSTSHQSENNTYKNFSLTPTKSSPYASAGDLSLFPYRQWSKCITKVARHQTKSMIYCDDPFGDHRLREAIARYLLDWRGIDVSANQIIVTGGSLDGLKMSIKTLLKDENNIGLENPGYLPLRNYINQTGLRTVWLSIDREGAITPNHQEKSHMTNLVVLTPSHQFPLGGAMSPGRRREFINWATKTINWIIEDDYDSEFRYSGKPIPAMMSLDKLGRTIYIGGFSKIFSTGLRLGFLVAPMELVSTFSHSLKRDGVTASLSMQRVLAEFMDTGEFYKHILRVRRRYGERRKLLINCLQTELSDIINYDNHQAGMQLAVFLPDRYDDKHISNSLKEKEILMPALSNYYAGKNSKKGLLIGFCSYQQDEIISNISILKTILK